MRNPFIKKSPGSQAVADFMDAIQRSAENGALGQTLGKEVASFESWSDPATAAQITDQLNNNLSVVKTTLATTQNLALESFMGDGAKIGTLEEDWVTKHQRDCAERAAAIAIEAGRDPRGFQSASIASMESSQAHELPKGTVLAYAADYTVGPRASSLGIGSQYGVSFEAFNENNLNAAMTLTVTYNLAAAIQDPMIEMFFKTVVMEPDQPTFFYEVAVDRYWNGKRHNDGKVERNFEKLLLTNAIRNPELLEQDVLNVVPFFQDAGPGANTDLFMDAALRTPTARTVAGVSVPTQPLKVGTEYDLLALSMHPDLTNGGVFDETDELDAMIALDNLYLTLDKAAEDGSIVKLTTVGLERRNFTKTIQGHGRDMDLNFESDEFILNNDTVDIKGAQIAKLQAITSQGYALRVRIDVRARANVETGYLAVQYAAAKVVGAVKVDNAGQPNQVITKVELSDPTLAGLLTTNLDMAVNYFDIDANRTNSNIRTQGMLLDRDVYTAKFSIGIRSPIRYQRKVGITESNQEILEQLVRATRIRQSADGFYELFRYRDTLKQYQVSEMRDDTRIPDYYGVAKYLVKPYYRYIELSMDEMVKTLDSKEALINAREFLVTVLQEAAADMIVKSQWKIAAVQQNNGADVTPHFAIGCGQYLPMLLSVQGDLRLLGANFEHTIKTSFNQKMDETIFMTLVDPKSEGLQPLGFGNTFYYPETVVSVSPHALNGAQRETFIVQPRYQHVAHLPILVEVKVAGLAKYINEYNVVRFKNV